MQVLEIYCWKKVILEIRYGYSSYKVDLGDYYCTCHLWELSDVDWVHAEAANIYIHLTPQDFSNPC